MVLCAKAAPGTAKAKEKKKKGKKRPDGRSPVAMASRSRIEADVDGQSVGAAGRAEETLSLSLEGGAAGWHIRLWERGSRPLSPLGARSRAQSHPDGGAPQRY